MSDCVPDNICIFEDNVLTFVSSQGNHKEFTRISQRYERQYSEKYRNEGLNKNINKGERSQLCTQGRRAQCATERGSHAHDRRIHIGGGWQQSGGCQAADARKQHRQPEARTLQPTHVGKGVQGGEQKET